MEKIRPAIIQGFNNDNDTIIVKKLTSKYHPGCKKFDNLKMNKTTFISKEKPIEIEEYKLIRYLGNLANERKKMR